MNVKELKEICEIVSVKGLIDNFILRKDGKVIAYDAAKSICVDLDYHSIDLTQDIGIGNVSGMLETFDRFRDDTPVEIENNKIVLRGTATANITLQAIGSPDKTVNLTQEDYVIVTEVIDYKVLNELAKLRVRSLMNEVYFFYIENGKLVMRIGEEDENNIAHPIIDVVKSSDDAMRLTMNVPECFGNIRSNAVIAIALDKAMLVTITHERYTVNYFLALSVE